MEVIITAKVHPYLIDSFTAKGFTVTYLPSITYAELLPIIGRATGLIVSTSIRVDVPLLDNAVQLQWIGRLGSGMDLIDVAYATTKGITCVSSPEGNCTSVGEHTLGLLLNLKNKITSSYLEIQQGQWIREPNRSFELGSKTVGIIGLGHTGSAFAKLLPAFGCKILAHDTGKSGFGTEHIQEASLEQIFNEAHIVSLHIPMDKANYHYANDAFFNAFQQQPLFLNACRGKVTDTAALIRALEKQQISGAGLDVLENEQLATYTELEQVQLNALLHMSNVIITPHLGGYSHEAFFKVSKILIDKLDGFLS